MCGKGRKKKENKVHTHQKLSKQRQTRTDRYWICVGKEGKRKKIKFTLNKTKQTKTETDTVILDMCGKRKKMKFTLNKPQILPPPLSPPSPSANVSKATAKIKIKSSTSLRLLKHT